MSHRFNVDVSFPATSQCIKKFESAAGIQRHRIRAAVLLYKINLPLACHLGGYFIASKIGQVSQSLQFKLTVTIVFHTGRPG